MPEEQGISTGLYKAMVRQNLPYQGKVGSGGRASKLLMTNARPINNSGTEFFMEVDYLNVYQEPQSSTRVARNKDHEKDEIFNSDQKKREAEQALLGKLEEWYREMKTIPSKVAGNVVEEFKMQREIDREYEGARLMIGHKYGFDRNKIPVSVALANKELLDRVEKLRGGDQKPQQGQIEPAMSAEKFHKGIAARDPFAYQAAQSPIVKGVATGMLMAPMVVPNIETLVLQGSISSMAQISVNGKISASSLITDAVLKGFPGIIIGSAIDWNPQDQGNYRTLGNGISMSEFGAKVATSLLIGRIFKGAGNSLEGISSPVKKVGLEIYTNYIETITAYGMSNVIDEVLDKEE